MPENRLVGIFADSQLCQAGIGIPASESVCYRWSRISPASRSYGQKVQEIIMGSEGGGGGKDGI